MSSISPPITHPVDVPTIGKRTFHRADLLQKPCIIGAFVDESDDDDDLGITEHFPKRRVLNRPNSPSAWENQLDDISTPPKVPRHLPRTTIPKAFEKLLHKKGDQDTELPNFLGKGPSTIGVNDLVAVSLQQEATAKPARPLLFSNFADHKEVRTCSGKSMNIRPRKATAGPSFEQLVAGRSTTSAGCAQKSYYGVDIHQLINDSSKENLQKNAQKLGETKPPIPTLEQYRTIGPRKSLMWTEKYRARRFFDLVGDDRTHREVLRWLKGWDPIVFPGSGKERPVLMRKPGMGDETEQKQHRKILLLTGPPGLGKTTLAHVCASQAGYEVMEINASDERSSNVVKGRIKTAVGTESVKTVSMRKSNGQVQKMARPVCVVIDEADGVAGGSGSGEAGFIKALIDLIQLDAKNTSEFSAATHINRRGKKYDGFRILRPLILICNDVYHPSLRLLRHSNFAEIVQIRKPPIEAVVKRMKSIFEKEGIPCDSDGVRKLCEATWGIIADTELCFDTGGAGEGDLRSVLVVGEWVAAKLRLLPMGELRLTRKWIEENMLGSLAHGGGYARSIGRGGVKEVVARVFVTGAGFPRPTYIATSTSTDPSIPRTKLHASELVKKTGMARLLEMIDTCGEVDRIITDIFSVYPFKHFNDDTVLSKPNAAYEWLHFHDMCSSRVFSDQDWEIAPYLSQGILACHHLFATPARYFSRFPEPKGGFVGEDGATRSGKIHPFAGLRADYDAKEIEKLNRATILELQSRFNTTLLRSFRSPEAIATDLLPYLVRILSPDVKPVIVGGGESRGTASVRKEGEREMVKRAVEVMSCVGVKFERGKLESDSGSRAMQWVYRMEPPLDTLADFPTAATSPSQGAVPVRYAVRQVLSQEYQKYIKDRDNAARQARYKAIDVDGDEPIEISDEKENLKSLAHTGSSLPTVKKDFFGRVIGALEPLGETNINNLGERRGGNRVKADCPMRIWVSFHEGYSNAVRKPISVEEILKGL